MQPDAQISDEPINHTNYLFGQDTHQTERNINAVLQQVPILAECLVKIDKKILDFQTPETLGDEILSDPVKFMHAMAARKMAIPLLKDEKAYIQSKINELPSEQ